MAMRRRRFFRRGGGGQPVQRQQPLWLTSNFNEASLDQTGLITEVNFFDPLQTVAGANNLTTSAAPVFRVKRIIAHGGITYVPTSTTFATEANALFMAVYVRDREDTDNTIVSTDQGTILEGGVRRVLHTNCYVWTSIEVPAATHGNPLIPSVARVDLDIKVNMRLRRDEILVMAWQYGSSATNTQQLTLYSATHRCLYVEP